MASLLVPLAAVGACRSDDAPDAPDAGGTTADAGGTAADAGGTTVEGVVQEATGGAAIPEARVCIEAHPEVTCATSRDDGHYTLAVPFLPLAAGAASIELAITATAPGHLANTRLVTEVGASGTLAGVLWPGNFLLRNDARASTFASAAGFSQPSTTTGFVTVRLVGPNAGDVISATASLSAGSRAVYGSPDGTPDPSLATTSSSGVLYFGDVPAGPFTITVAAMGKTCTVAPPSGLIAGDWTAPTDAIRGVAVAGSETSALTAICQ